jgi:membrane-associated phospholipid phosphatase
MEAALEQPQPDHPLLPASARPVAAMLLAVCVVITTALGLWYADQSRAGRLDSAVDVRIQALFSARSPLLSLVQLGDPLPMAVMTGVLLVACVAARRWRAAALVAVAVPGSMATTEFLLKPLINRTFFGEPSYPSGHATGVFAVAVTFAVLLVDPPGTRLPVRLRVTLAVAALVAAVVTAVAIVGVHSHYATDTVGGAAVGTASVLLTALVLDRLARSRD